jgi:hypothetical protein
MYLNNLQSLIFSIIMLMIIGFVSCEKTGEKEVSYILNERIILETGETAFLNDNNVSLYLRLNKIKDSRCPVQANCISAGSAFTEITLSNRNNNKITVSIGIGEISDFKAGNLDVKLDEHTYRITLEEVLPYPDLDDHRKQKATFYLEKI